MTKKAKKEKYVPTPQDELIGFKIIHGEMLTEEEFNRAKEIKAILNNPSYEDFKLVHYEDERTQGYLCISNGKINPENHLGKGKMCFIGAHREDVNPEKLRPEQKRFW